MNHKMLRPFIVKVSVLGYFPLGVNNQGNIQLIEIPTLQCTEIDIPNINIYNNYKF